VARRAGGVDVVMAQQRSETKQLKSEKILHLGSLKKGSPGISSAIGETFAQAAAVCLEEQRHVSGTEMKVDGDFNSNFTLFWDKVTAQMKRSLADLQQATEWGAYGMAALLVQRLTSLTVVERACKGTGFDYWLGLQNDVGSLFQNKKRLEVSGILKGDDAVVKSRVGEKLSQTEAYPSRLAVFVVVVEFGGPRSRVISK